jgi:signal transduction histidine kinase
VTLTEATCGTLAGAWQSTERRVGQTFLSRFEKAANGSPAFCFSKVRSIETVTFGHAGTGFGRTSSNEMHSGEALATDAQHEHEHFAILGRLKGPPPRLISTPPCSRLLDRAMCSPPPRRTLGPAVLWSRTSDTGRPVVIAGSVAVALVAIVILLKYLTHGPLGREAPFLLMLGATVAATWFGGRWAGVVATVCGAAAVEYLFLPPYNSWSLSPAAAEQIAVFGAESLLVVALTSMLGRALSLAEASTRHVRALHAVSSALARAHTPEDVGSTVVREGAAALGSDVALFFVAAEERSRLRLVAHHGAAPELVAHLSEMPFDAGQPCAATMRTGHPVAVSRQEDLRAAFPRLFATPGCERHHAALCVPVRADGPTLGVLAFRFLHDVDLRPEDRELAEALARDCAVALTRARLHEAERRAHLEAEEASRTKDEFLGVVSHELRTPLTAIAGWVHLLRQGWKDDPERLARGLDVIERNVTAERRLVEDLLDVSRIVSRRLKVGQAPLELASVVRAVLEELEPSAAAKGVELALRASGVVPVVGDPERLAQVTRNLVGNAIKFTPAGGHVSVDVARSADRATLCVRDDGAGIEEDLLPFVFEAFRQGDRASTRREAGLGLGLSIVQGLVAAHEGRVRIESAGRGRGTTVVVDLPSPAGHARKAMAQAPGAPAAVLAGLRVLVVDDEADTLEAVCALLTEAGADVRGVASAGAALDVVEHFSPNVLVSDIAMPERDGYWLIRRLRAADTPTARCPALALSTHVGGETARAAIDAGYQRHLAKPPVAEVLATTIAQLARTAGH